VGQLSQQVNALEVQLDALDIIAAQLFSQVGTLGGLVSVLTPIPGILNTGINGLDSGKPVFLAQAN
jgi:hypothetical protein